MLGLTPRQRDVLAFLKSYRAREGVAPSLQEIAEQFTFRRVTAFGHLRALEKKGYIRRARGRVRAIEIVEPDDSRPQTTLAVYGYLVRGEPLEPAAEYEDLDLGAVLSPGRDLVAFRARGDSFAEGGIRDGDYVVIERRARAEPGETVLALVKGGQAFIGKVRGGEGRGGRGGFLLEPAGAEGAAVTVRKALVQGVVVAVIRRY